MQAITRPDQVTKIGKAAQNREKHELQNEKPKLDNARRLRGTYFIDLDDQDHKETFKNARRKLKRPMTATMPCERMVHASTTKVPAKQDSASQKIPRTIYGCMVESHECPRQRVESSLITKHEDQIAGKGFTSMTHYNLGYKFIPMPQAMRLPDAKSCSGQAMEISRDNSSIATGKSQEQKGIYSRRSTKRQKESPLCYTDGHMSPRTRS